MKIYVKQFLSLLYFFYFFLVSHDFIECGDFTYMAASKRASDDVTN